MSHRDIDHLRIDECGAEFCGWLAGEGFVVADSAVPSNEHPRFWFPHRDIDGLFVAVGYGAAASATAAVQYMEVQVRVAERWAQYFDPFVPVGVIKAAIRACLPAEVRRRRFRETVATARIWNPET